MKRPSEWSTAEILLALVGALLLFGAVFGIAERLLPAPAPRPAPVAPVAAPARPEVERTGDVVVVRQGRWRTSRIELPDQPEAVDRLVECLRARLTDDADVDATIDRCVSETTPGAPLPPPDLPAPSR